MANSMDKTSWFSIFTQEPGARERTGIYTVAHSYICTNMLWAIGYGQHSSRHCLFACPSFLRIGLISVQVPSLLATKVALPTLLDDQSRSWHTLCPSERRYGSNREWDGVSKRLSKTIIQSNGFSRCHKKTWQNICYLLDGPVKIQPINPMNQIKQYTRGQRIMATTFLSVWAACHYCGLRLEALKHYRHLSFVTHLFGHIHNSSTESMQYYTGIFE